ncbi:hypothetical protein [Synechococcus sp. CCY 9618]|uniref:hypothetical protein n=1 Tax=Synechococcus sp. CCY 9618 TaxID=2815602 RepID=UPI001C234CD5|nr:hypothetical protein [Synechococcus sp. CCY 9618]
MADPVPPPSDLPAPYASPWGQLSLALRAVVASLRLKARELWRRNAEGDLSVPGFWPQGLAALFWPLLLAFLLAMPLLVWRLLPHRAPDPAPAAGGAPPVSLAPPAAVEPPEIGTAEEPVAPASPAPEPPPLELDPLLTLLADDDPDHLIASAHPETAHALLVLTMQPAYGLQAPAARRRWAERWQERARALGYGRLQLVDGGGQLLARGALVGSGMILLDPGPPP